MKFITLNFPEKESEIVSAENDYQKLFNFGSKINDLLSKAEISSNPSAVGLLDDLLGAVYSLILARHNLFENRNDKPIEINAVQTRASQIMEGRVRIDGKWIAGWHFNSAIYRISSVFHRLLKLISNKSKGNIGKLLLNVTIEYKKWTGMEWIEDNARKVQDEVNKLKHDAEGIYSARKVTFENALDSISSLLDLIVEWSKVSHKS